jgi:hypothetical protein
MTEIYRAVSIHATRFVLLAVLWSAMDWVDLRRMSPIFGTKKYPTLA